MKEEEKGGRLSLQRKKVTEVPRKCPSPEEEKGFSSIREKKSKGSYPN